MVAASQPTGSGWRRFARPLRLVAALVVAALVAWYGWKQDWRGIAASLAHAKLTLVALAMAGNVPLVWLKARRAQLLWRATAPTTTGALARCYLTSYAADNLLMSQAGLGVRVAFARRLGSPWSTATALQVVEKALEAVGLAALALGFVRVSSHGGALASAMRACFAVAVVGIVVGAALLVARRRDGLAGRLGDAGHALTHPRTALAVAALTAAAWLVELAMALTTLAALGLPASSTVGALVLVAVNVAALVPGLPANVGPFEASATLALRAVGVAAAPALGFALLYHVLHTLPVTAAGLPGLRRAGLRRPAPELDAVPSGDPSGTASA